MRPYETICIYLFYWPVASHRDLIGKRSSGSHRESELIGFIGRYNLDTHRESSGDSTQGVTPSHRDRESISNKHQAGQVPDQEYIQLDAAETHQETISIGHRQEIPAIGKHQESRCIRMHRRTRKSARWGVASSAILWGTRSPAGPDRALCGPGSKVHRAKHAPLSD